MNKNNFQHQEKLLSSLRAKLIKKLEGLNKVADYGESADDNAQEVSNETTTLSLKKDIINEIKSIDKALEAIKFGKYGICQACQSAIEDSRLKLVTTALYCSSCQQKVGRK